ncbi:MAG TPA: O-antigen ligase family protein [Sphingomonadaceae bacterium]|nr:O-antigen ligase family protein [Sphingomonadaceae bacterium]
MVILLQFVPLPVEVWKDIPGRAEILAPLDAAGIPFPLGFVSLIPHESLKSAIWLLPAVGVLLAMMRARALFSGRRIAVALVATMSLAVFVGAMQLASGSGSSLYFYHFTNRGSAVGFFANANHMASLLLVAIPFQAALLRGARERKNAWRMAAITAIAASFAVTVAGIAVNGSFAGYGLLLPVSLASALIVWGNRKARLAALLLACAVGGGMVLILATHDGQALLDQASGMPGGSREVIFARTLAAIGDFWPVGTGVGTFAEIYPSYEDPLTVTRTYINHAHNDYLELLLETGILGLIVLLGFLLWWVVRAGRIWAGAPTSPFARAAVIASATLLVHSLVDYPLRTAALSSLFAACVALMAAPRQSTQVDEREAVFGRG